MRVARDLGISHKRFLGWVPSDGEAEWDEDERALVIASFEVEAETPGHGIHLSDATSVEADPANREGAFKFVVGNPIVDYAEKARRDAEDAYKSHYKDANMNGLFFPVRKVDRA